MQDILRNYIPGTIIRCTYVNAAGKGERLVYLEDRPENPGYTVYQSDLLTGSFIPIFGMKLINASTMNRHSYAVTEIVKGGIADESGFSVNDPITVSDVKFSDDSSSIYAELYTRKK